MIQGLTHDEKGVVTQVAKYKGKISTGFGPNEGPNKENHPIACGYFRMLKEIIQNKTIGGAIVPLKVWKENADVQKKLEESLNSKTPRKLDFLCLFASPNQFWESSLAMYSGMEGLLCKSQGSGTKAKELKKDSAGKREWKERDCQYKDCPDFKAGRCKEIGLMKVFPLLDMSPNPYRFETRSIYTILGMEASLDKYFNLLKAAHLVKRIEAKKEGKEIPFDGFFGLTFSLIHKKAKGGGREIYITDLVPTPETASMIMEPINRGVKLQQTAALTAGSDSFSLLNANPDEMLQIESPDDIPSAAMDADDDKGIASQFGADADKNDPDDAAVKKAAETLMDNK